MIKTLSILGIEEIFLNTIKEIYKFLCLWNQIMENNKRTEKNIKKKIYDNPRLSSTIDRGKLEALPLIQNQIKISAYTTDNP